MTSTSKPRITLELEAGGDPIRGSIEHADGSRKSFWGWLELSAELRRVAADDPGHPARLDAAEAGPAPEPDA